MRPRRLFVFLILAGIASFVTCQGSDTSAPALKDGDIVFQDFPSRQSTAVKLATQSEYSHCGVIFFEDGQPIVWEAVQPVRVTPLDEWIERDTTGHYVVKRLRGADTLLNALVIDSMRTIGRSYLGRDYDIYFAWSDSELYCSEFVWKLYHIGAGIELASLRPMGDYDLSHPEVRKIMAQRWGEKFPSDEPVVSPQDLFDSDLLELVVGIK
ncbi:MAG: YiiX family permuted papain-like enzyme [Candidatus Zixiibacteriota bacterium]